MDDREPVEPVAMDDRELVVRGRASVAGNPLRIECFHPASVNSVR
jgi:hypothetical protein